MNLYKQFNNGVNQLNALGNYINNSNLNPNSDYITEVICQCTYPEEYFSDYPESSSSSKNQSGRS